MAETCGYGIDTHLRKEINTFDSSGNGLIDDQWRILLRDSTKLSRSTEATAELAASPL